MRKRSVHTSVTVTFLPALLMWAAFLTSRMSVGAQAAANADHDRLLFERRCAGCHSLDQDREGPRLRNVYGRKSASIATFKYSDALKATHIIWNDAWLDKWLTNPESIAPDTEMDFSVPKAEERAAIIRYLRLSSGK